ncbi:Methylase involved in ubiquinone/menaquinone biosynthesi [Pseudomonas cichorii]|uniref:Methylase involved in ubiquinone/menaquinone biosynthesi n=1 Tax=Pseudomonas cichorii TaxID=36746 RepID=A0A3M4LS57_PSECI|nr:class I SAM-dependent methyltransferase [Pseudomonas cichorii]RMQ44337.1 Methylase involved in ubiquinone/menaquinone biosynthesi [Pseudomonas cichorii]
MNSKITGNETRTAFEQFEYDGWEKVADTYHQAWGHTTSPFAVPLLDIACLFPGARALDVATGPGYAAALAANAGASVVGVDFSESMLEHARQLHPSIHFEFGDVHALPFEQGYFDSVFSNFGVQHFSNPERAFSEVARVLRKNGTWAFTLWAPDQLNKAGEVLNQALDQHAGGVSPVPAGPAYHELDDFDSLARLLERAGFEATSVSRQLTQYTWLMKSPSELFQSELIGSVRSGARLREQPEAVLQEIDRSMTDSIRSNWSTPDGFALPMAAYVISAVKS